MPEDAPPNRRPTDLLDPKRLETESRVLLLPGFLCGFLFFALILRCIPATDRLSASAGDREHGPRLTLTFITIRPEPPGSPAPSRASRPRSPHPRPPVRAPESPVTAAGPETTLSATPSDSASPSRLVLRGAFLPDSCIPRPFPNLADSAEILSRTPQAIAAREEKFRELERRFGKKTRRGKPEIFSDNTYGDKGMLRVNTDVILDGARSLVKAGRRLAKTMHENRTDVHSRKNPKTVRREDVRAAYGPELRFLILLWRDGRADPSLLVYRDRTFLARGGPAEGYPPRELLAGMERDGLVISAPESGGRFYRAGCDRGDMLQILVRRFGEAASEAQRDSARAAIDLITRCTDLSTGRVAIPDSVE